MLELVRGRLDRCSLTNKSISHDGTYRKARGRPDRCSLLVEELIKIYNTPTPKGWREAEKVIGID